MKLFDDFFVFSSSEKRGIYLFLILIFLLCLIYWLMPYFLKPSKTDFSDIRAKLEEGSKKAIKQEANPELFYFNPNQISKDSLELLGFSSKQAWNTINYRKKVKNFDSKDELKKLYAMTDSLYSTIEPYILLEDKKSDSKPIAKKKFDIQENELFDFNPNTINKDSLIMLGFNAKTANIFIGYRNSRGGFSSKEDLKKVYGVSDSLFNKIVPFIKIPKEKPPIEEVKIISLNSSSKEELMKAKGIGPVFSERIIEYRTKLGGFVSINQLEEVYGIDKEWIDKYGKQFVINKSELSKININTIEFKKLLKHPYFSYSEVKRIITYRDMHGKFSSLKQIQENNLINPEQYRKIVSYLSLD